MKAKQLLPVLLLNFAFCNGKVSADSHKSKPLSKQFKKYWFSGKGELSKFDLIQARYGYFHKGHAIMVFVTESFLPDKQVKDDWDPTPGSIPVLKQNFQRRFVTGIYDYSLMTSNFLSLKSRHLLKTTFTEQDWCGHVFSQANFRDNEWKIQVRSYFEDESDQDYTLPDTLTEEELMLKIRINPNSIPLGKQNVIPTFTYTRLRHRKTKAYAANVTMSKFQEKGFPGKNLMALTVKYHKLQRTYQIIFEKEFPHLIAGWKERYVSGFDEHKKMMTTVAKRTHLYIGPYWNKHTPKDVPLRQKLGLPLDKL
ncbi:MAG: septum formation inhibitor Maf [Candidatus Hydrogenedentota bacterium]|nr:MAG: septum formation inhibitor Maf [Candidatus Hydrogenedentota bacterium]